MMSLNKKGGHFLQLQQSLTMSWTGALDNWFWRILEQMMDKSITKLAINEADGIPGETPEGWLSTVCTCQTSVYSNCTTNSVGVHLEILSCEGDPIS